MNLKRLFVAVLALIAALSFGSLQLAAQTQTTGSVAGVVSDPSNASVPDAKVVLKDTAKGGEQTTTSNREGAYRFSLLSPGNYLITVTIAGFQPASRQVSVELGQVATANIQLALAASSQTVTVTEAAPLVQAENGNNATTLDEQQVSQVPNPGNDLSYVAQMAPGSVMNTTTGLGNFSSFGVSASANLFTLNGMDDNDPFLNLNNSGATNLTLGQNEVQEATVVANGYSAQYGGLAGANVSYITKSGSNQFHGNALYYWNGSSFNANDWFQNEAGKHKPFSNANQWAGSFGGPIKKDKLFFYGNTEGLRVILPTVFPQVLVPTPEFATATLANLQNNGHAASVPFYQSMFKLYSGAAGTNAVTPIACPAGITTSTGNCTESFQSSANNLTHEWQGTGRVDYNIGNNDRAFLRVEYDHGLQASVTDEISNLFNIQSDQPQWQGQLVENHVFGPTMTNQFILSGAWYSALFDNASRAKALTAFRTTLAFGDGSLTQLGGNCCAGLGNSNFPQGRNVTQYQVSDDISKTRGNHSFSFGAKYRRNDVSDHDLAVNTSGLLSETSLKDFFAGGSTSTDPLNPGNTYAQAFPSQAAQPIALYTLGMYAQDQWRIKPSLTLTLSLRAEHQSNPVCQTNCFARLINPFLSATHDVNQPYSAAIRTGLHQMLQGLDAVVWQPRFGFAWQPFGTSHSTVLRGGIGLFNDAFPGVLVDVMAANAPNVNTFVVSNGNISPAEATSVYAAAAADNMQFLQAFRNNGTLASILTILPNFSPPTLGSADRMSRIPQYQKWSLEIQQGFGQNTSLSVGYVGNHGIHELAQNAAVNAFGFGSLPGAAPDARFGIVTQYQSAGVSNYNGLTVSFRHRLTGWSQGQFSANYTWSHAFDISSNGGSSAIPFSFANSFAQIQDPKNIFGNYGPADYDIRHNFNANYVWEVPVRKALLGHGPSALVEGWQVSGTVFAQSAQPYSVFDGAFSAALASQNYGSFIFPKFLGGSTDMCGKRAAFPAATRVLCLTKSQFVGQGQETGFTPGLRNAFRGPGYFDTDFTVLKNTKIPGWERGKLGIGFQFFNLFNHPNFSTPRASLSSSRFARILTTATGPTSILGSGLGGDSSPRIIQLKAQLTF